MTDKINNSEEDRHLAHSCDRLLEEFDEMFSHMLKRVTVLRERAQAVMVNRIAVDDQAIERLIDDCEEIPKGIELMANPSPVAGYVEFREWAGMPPWEE